MDERGSTYNSAPPSIELNGTYFAQATTTMMIKIKSSESTHRSVRFAETTSQPMVLPNINCGWYSRADKSRFERETVQQARQLRSILAQGGSVDLSEDDLIQCTGIEPLVLYSRRNLISLREMKAAHADVILAAQHHLNPSELSLVSRRSSDGARERAHSLASV